MMRPHEFRRGDLPVERVFTDAPMEHMWARFERIATPEGAENLIVELARTCRCDPPECISEKARGLAFAIRSATEYFKPRAAENLTLSALSYYYGSMWLLSAVMMADPTTAADLEMIEGHTRQGHGLGNIDDQRPGVPFPDDTFLYVKNGGLFTEYLRSIDVDMSAIVVHERVEGVEDLEDIPHWSLTDLFARIPEILSTWDEVMDRPPDYVAVRTGSEQDSTRTIWWLEVVDRYSSLHFPDIQSCYALTGMPRTDDPEILRKTNDRPWAYAVDEENAPFGLPLHTSAWCPTAYIKPLAPGIDNALQYHFITLYALSILVRYQPHKWREVLEGRKEYRRQLVSEYLLTAERIAPNLLLDRLVLRRHIFAAHSYWA